jgi:hypothetical protein
MNVAAKALQGNKLAFDPSLDVNEDGGDCPGGQARIDSRRTRN